MPRPRAIIPAYRLHAATGQAVVTIFTTSGTRRDVYLGPHGSDASVIAFGRALIEWKSGKRDAGGLSVAEVLLAYLDHAKDYYGAKSQEYRAMKIAIRPARLMFGALPAVDFGPKALTEVRDALITGAWKELDPKKEHKPGGWCRQQTNRMVNRIRRAIKWATATELIPAEVLTRLQSVPGLKRGRCGAREAPPVLPVADADVNATLPFLTPTVQAMVRFQRLTGCRPGEACNLRMADVDRSGDVWLYRPRQHKLAWRGRERSIAIGPKAQQVVLDLLAGQPLDPESPVFSPRQAMAERAERLREHRKTPVQPSQRNRKKSNPKKSAGRTYTAMTYNKAVQYAIKRAKTAGKSVNSWHVNRLRHARATELRRLYGIEAAKAAAGHTELRTTELYAERDIALAVRVAKETG